VVFLLKNPVHHEHSSLEREGKKAPRKQREVSDSICSNNIPLIVLCETKVLLEKAARKKSKWCANWISLVILILRLEVYSGYAGTLTSCRLLRSSERASNLSIVIAQHLRILFHLW
jgi:hypothetical protein